MYLKEYLNQYMGEDIKLFVDMDGVIADYDIGNPGSYDKKRPLFTSINKLEEISKMENVELYILSVSRMDIGVSEKNLWLDKYAPFFKEHNRVIIPRESNDYKKSDELKSEYLSSLERDGSKIIFIDDDVKVIDLVRMTNPDVILLKDTVLVD